MDLKELKEIIKLMDGTDITEIDIERDGMRIKLKKGYPVPLIPYSQPSTHNPIPALAHSVNQSLAPPLSSETKAITSPGKNLIYIDAPMVGTFYRAPAPDAEPYIEVGDTVEKGQIVCIIEAMKLMNEIEAEVKGKVVEILVENGQPVEYGQPLFLIDPLAPNK